MGSCADLDAPEPDLVAVEKHLRKRKCAGQREKLIKESDRSLPGNLWMQGMPQKRNALYGEVPGAPSPGHAFPCVCFHNRMAHPSEV